VANLINLDGGKYSKKLIAEKRITNWYRIGCKMKKTYPWQKE
jgi:hypothetical protein